MFQPQCLAALLKCRYIQFRPHRVATIFFFLTSFWLRTRLSNESSLLDFHLKFQSSMIRALAPWIVVCSAIFVSERRCCVLLRFCDTAWSVRTNQSEQNSSGWSNHQILCLPWRSRAIYTGEALECHQDYNLKEILIGFMGCGSKNILASGENLVKLK